MSALSLEAALEEIAAEHNLTTVTVGRQGGLSYTAWIATVHWSGYANDGCCCDSATSEISIADALKMAIEGARRNRVRDIDIPTLELAL